MKLYKLFESNLKIFLSSLGTSIQNIGKELWKDSILLHPSLANHWKKIVTEGINFIRNVDCHHDMEIKDKDSTINQLVNTTNQLQNTNNQLENTTNYNTMNSLLKNMFDMWRELNLYFVHEKLVLDQTRSYYSLYSTSIIQKYILSDTITTVQYQKYLEIVCDIIDREISKTMFGTILMIT